MTGGRTDIGSGNSQTSGEGFSSGIQGQLSGMAGNQILEIGGQTGETKGLITGVTSTGLGLAKGMGDLSGMGTGQSLPKDSESMNIATQKRDHGYAGMTRNQ